MNIRRYLFPCVVVLLGTSVQARALVDPTRPPWDGPAALIAQHPSSVQAIWIRKGRRMALIDGRLVSPGSRFGRGVVLAIHRRKVVLRFPAGLAVWPLVPAHARITKSWILSGEKP